MPKITFSLDDEYYEKLKEMARKDGVSIQDCIRSRLFQVETIFTPAEAVRRVSEKRATGEYGAGELFTLPKLYGDEWTIERGVAGSFGKQFFNYVSEECAGKIEFVGMTDYGRHAQYKAV